MGNEGRKGKTSVIKKQKISANTPQVLKSSNSKTVSETLLECLHTGNLDAFREVLASHIMNTNKLRFAQETGIARRTLYDILDPKMNFDPALSTISAIIRGLARW